MITGIGALFALIEVVYILMILFGANQANSFFLFIKSLAEPLALFFPGLFDLGNYNLSRDRELRPRRRVLDRRRELACSPRFALNRCYRLVVTGQRTCQNSHHGRTR